ncbi:uncharacterized protein LOC121862948 isoform X5 [Homarus americanus]|uniref:uncharacterized protein LOC121862948 isoform X5 n=1 Tax=Homarus americanus TaxID=6706 RepID=UPI001C4797E5|nr:uncharacterized protein LOC121862948 isoform X5 [Homarus americanus]
MRERCGSMPSRSRTSSEGSVQNVPNKLQGPNCPHQMDGPMASSLCLHVTRPKSIPSSSESMESTASTDDFEGLHSQPSDNNAEGPCLVSPVSGSSTEGPCISSPQDNYLEMASPSERVNAALVGSHPERGSYLRMDRAQAQLQGNSGPESSGYLSMGPLSSPGSLLPAWPSHSSSQVSSPPHSANHSRIPSLVDDTMDSYLSMVPGGHLGDAAVGETFVRERSEGYLDMTPTPAVPTPIPYSPSDGDSFPEMSPGSSCSFTSGTPSSDHRFPDFIAEKTGSGSYYGYSEDDDSSLDRPIRTNSVGSKPEQFRSRKNR